MNNLRSWLVATTITCLSAPAWADDGQPLLKERMAPPSADVRFEVPHIGLANSAFTGTAGAFGAVGLASGRGDSQFNRAAGGVTIFGSPIERLTLVASAEQRLVKTSFAPIFSAMVRLAGSLSKGWALGAMVTYKAEGFAEIEGEVELGVNFSLLRGNWHVDVNAVVGAGFEESEVDAELFFRFAYDLNRWFSLGMDSRVRHRLSGEKKLAGGRGVDFIAGPQAVFGTPRFFVGLTAGASTVQVRQDVGWVTLLSVGGATFF
jgi:hypothetical protein